MRDCVSRHTRAQFTCPYRRDVYLGRAHAGHIRAGSRERRIEDRVVSACPEVPAGVQAVTLGTHAIVTGGPQDGNPHHAELSPHGQTEMGAKEDSQSDLGKFVAHTCHVRRGEVCLAAGVRKRKHAGQRDSAAVMT